VSTIDRDISGVTRDRGEGNLERIRMDTLSYVHRGAHFKEQLKRIG